MWLAMTRQCVGIAAMGGDWRGQAKVGASPAAKPFSETARETELSRVVTRRYFDFSPAVFTAITR